MLLLERRPLRWSTGPPSGCFHRLEISLDQTSIFQLYQIIFNAFRTISPSPGTVTWKLKQSKLRMPTRVDEKNRITRLEIRFILETKNLRLRIKKKGRSAKFYPRYVGPFEISKTETATSNYTLKLPPEYRIHPKVHARRLKLAHDNDPKLFPGRIPPNPPPIDAEDEQYAVEAILDHRKVGRSRQFLVHWEGYSDTEDSLLSDQRQLYRW